MRWPKLDKKKVLKEVLVLACLFVFLKYGLTPNIKYHVLNFADSLSDHKMKGAYSFRYKPQKDGSFELSSLYYTASERNETKYKEGQFLINLKNIDDQVIDSSTVDYQRIIASTAPSKNKANSFEQSSDKCLAFKVQASPEVYKVEIYDRKAVGGNKLIDSYVITEDLGTWSKVMIAIVFGELS